MTTELSSPLSQIAKREASTDNITVADTTIAIAIVVLTAVIVGHISNSISEYFHMCGGGGEGGVVVVVVVVVVV